MPTVQISRSHLDRMVGKKLSDSVLSDVLAGLGTGCDAMDAKTVTIEVEPNRPDLLGAEGLARAISALIGSKTGLRSYTPKASNYRVIVNRNVSKVRPRTACAVVTGLRFDDERIKNIVQMQEKLHVSHCRNRRKAAIGIYPLDKISWPVRFESRSPSEISFMPLEASREMTATQILSAHPTGKQYAHLLEGEKSYPVFVDSSDQILSMPPIINSALTGRVTEDTKDVFVECSGFDQQFLDNLLSIIVCALVDEGGQVKTVEVAYSSGSYSTPVLKPTTMPISIAYINRLLGLSLNETEIKRLLSRTGLGYSAKKAIIPPYRVDILHQIDLVEEVLIAYGLDNINPEHNEAATIGGENPLMVFRQRVADLIVGLGLVETSTYHLDSEVNQTVRSGSSLPVVKLENPRTSEYNCLRAWITPSLLEVFRTNKHRDYPQRIFCCGTIFSPDKSAECGVAEKQSIAIATSHVRVDFTETRQLAEALFCALGIEASWVENENGWAIPGRCASAKIGNREVAVIGEIHPKVLSEWQLEMPVSVLEIDLESLFAAVSSR